MTDSSMQLAFREWLQLMARYQTLASLAAVTLVLVLVAPFDTDTRLGVAERLVYWAVLTFASYACGAFVNIWVQTRFRSWSRAARVTLSGLFCAASIVAIVVAANFVAFGWIPQGLERLTFIATVGAIALIINTALALLVPQTPEPGPDMRPAPGAAPGPSSGPETTRTTTAAPPPLLERLPLDKRGPLVALSVEDHYVHVRTAKGEEMILMRLSDAIREVGDTRGAQVHRSHWVAFDAVTAAARQGDRAILTMSHGSAIPVSRANMTVIKEAGLLPR